ncbi:MAG: molybdopterin-guanine dinucleotide biosynthesis protein B [Desulfomonilia bacterium]|jgi:molybdopterin-guanine dinucleotide biosynthesis protein B|nr:molybdopterin-guanine dinucleotide biosynthesis protein B [Deltaproteobacteria bacterium]MDX9760635.1 molybdopterin-guanine dinucleotide biosynthesis protein B [Desulfomonilia bacterium]HPW68853.1 molybdopterin-guanine dinucleotide biosynthesis protein B [Deltaproteobacteria bacterium]
MYGNIVSFVAKGTDSGKTFLIERLIEEYKKRGLKVAAVKHANHLDQVDREGKDTHRFARKGADRIVLFSDHALMLYEFSRPGTDYLVELAGKSMDIVFVEGFKKGPFPKIEVFNPSLYDAPLCLENPDEKEAYIALVSKEPFDAGLPWFSFGDIKGLCTFIDGRIRQK